MKYLSILALAALAFGSQTYKQDYIVVLRNDPDSVIRSHGLVAKHKYYHALKGFSARLNESQVDILSRDPSVAYIERDGIVKIDTQETLPGISRVAAPSHPNFSSATGVNIAIIDTGVEQSNADLNVVSFVDFTGEGAFDGNGHGTHVAGIAAAKNNSIGVVGVAPGARIHALKAVASNGLTVWSNVIAAMDYIVAHSTEIEVANMSFGEDGYLISVRTAVVAVVNSGVVLVVSAGNQSKDVYGLDGRLATADDRIPASFPEAMTVSAMGDSDGSRGSFGPDSPPFLIDDTIAGFSNFSNGADTSNPVVSWGGAIDLAAPGVNVLSLWPAGLPTCGVCQPGFNILSGTSQAAPHVTGSVALYIAQHGRATNAAGVYAIRQAINAGEPQSSWQSGSTLDLELYNEFLVFNGPPAWPPPGSPPAHFAPAAPSNLTLIERGHGGGLAWIAIQWADNANNESNIEIWRSKKTGGQFGPFSQLVMLSPNMTSHYDFTVKASSSYAYKVRMYNAIGYSDYSNTLVVP